MQGNAKVLLWDFAIFSCILNIGIAWLLPALAGDVLLSYQEVFIDGLVTSVIIILMTCLFATFGARRMLNTGRLKPVRLNRKGSIWSIQSESNIFRLMILMIGVLSLLSAFFYTGLKYQYIGGVPIESANIMKFLYCGFLGLIITPIVAVNSVIIVFTPTNTE